MWRIAKLHHHVKSEISKTLLTQNARTTKKIFLTDTIEQHTTALEEKKL